jgi:hypothetical protein
MQSTDGGAPLEYLPLVTGSNYSTFLASSQSPGTTVTTTYTKVRIDPIALVIHGGDQTFASSSGSLFDVPDNATVLSVPYGVAIGCSGVGSVGSASMDLTGTGFSFPINDFAASSGGAGDADYLSNTDVTLNGGGAGCGWFDGDPSGPVPENTADVTFSVTYSGEDAGGG